MLFDHIIIATTDLDRSAHTLAAQTGLTAVEGGLHDGLGTHNRIVPLGRGYLELVAVHDPEMAASNVFGQLVVNALGRRDEALAGWAVEVSAAELARRARAGKLEIGRLTRAGVGIDHAGMSHAITSPGLPFFLARDEQRAHPQHLAAEHRSSPRGRIAVAVGESAAEMDRWLGSTTPLAGQCALTCTGSGRGVMSVAVETSSGTAVLTDALPTGNGAQ